MNGSLHRLHAAYHRVDESRAAEPSALSEASLLDRIDSLAELRRATDIVITAYSAELAQRSRRELGAAGLAKRLGFPSATHLLADALSTRRADAAALIAVGEAARTRSSITGAALPPRFPHLSAALAAGAMSVEQARTVTEMLDRVRARAIPEHLDQAERQLTAQASMLGPELLARLARRWEALLDEDGLEPSDGERRAARGLMIGTSSTGMVTLRGSLDPESGAPLIAAIDALVAEALRSRPSAESSEPGRSTVRAADEAELLSTTAHLDAAAPAGDPRCGAEPRAEADVHDVRSLPQLRADALVELAEHALACLNRTGATGRPVSGTATTVVVRMRLDELRRELAGAEGRGSTGAVFIDGIDTPLPAAAARRRACDAELIPLVFGGASEPLDLGRSRRLFSRAQRLALAERDGGCAFPGCSRPPHWCDAHHVRWWERDTGATDLDNGVLLCRHHHVRVHTDGWLIALRDGVPWFTPPAQVDPVRRPRPGGFPRIDGLLDLGAPRPGAPRTEAPRTEAPRTEGPGAELSPASGEPPPPFERVA